MKQKILAVDSQILNEIQNCARKAELAHIKNLRPLEKADALEKGDLMHKMLQTYYSLKLGQVSADLWDSLTEAGVNPSDKPQDAAISGGYFFAAKSSLPEDISQEVIFQFREYVDHYKHDSWSPLAVEEVGSKIMYEDEDLKIIYSFKIDLIAEKGNIVAPFDHKTGSTTKEPSSLSNQFIGYAWALGSNTVIVNKIGFKRLYPGTSVFYATFSR